MIASYKEAGKSRKWLLSVVAGFMVLISCLMPLIKSVDVSAETQYELVLRTDDGRILKTVSLGNTLNGGGNYVARVNAGGNGRYSITIENNLTGQVLGTLDNISPDRITANNDSSFTNAQFNFKLELWQDGGTVASGTPISVSGGMEKRAWVIAADDDGDGTYEVRYSQPSGEGYTSMTDRTVDQNQIGATVQGNSAAQTVNANDDDEKDNVREECISSGKAGSLGWIVCPVLIFLSDSANDLYEEIEPYLYVDTDIFDFGSGGTEGGGTFDAWLLFQRFANIAFVILFMVVVISQVTGIGINNYGIKKILPKLIVTAILVNISYWLCLIVVDISNIVGNSLQNMLASMGTPYAPSGEAAAVIGVTIMMALLGGGIAIVLNPAVILGLLISAIGLVVSLLTLLVLLAMRKAIIVVLVVASPIAIVCYMLPNTKKVFDKWIKVAEGMLLLYPTASLLVGAGSFVSRLMMSTEAGQTFFGAFIAILVSIVPIFFIPKLLTSAFAAVGNIGAKVSGIGKNLGGRVQGRVGNSEAFKRAQTRMNAGANRNGEVTGLNKVREKLAKSGAGKAIGLDRTMAAARAQMVKDRYSDQRTGSMVGEGFPAALIEQQKAAEKEEMLQYMTLINNDTRNGEDQDKLFAMFDQYMADGNKAGAVAVARIAGRRKDTAARFLGEKITGATLDPGKAGYNEKLAALNANTSDERRALFQGVAKEIATGENSGSYREASPLGFEFAAAHNRDANTTETDENGKPKWKESTDYSKWANEANVSRATGNYLTNSKELVGAKNSSLEEIASAMAAGNISADEKTRLQHLAQMTIDNRNTTGVWDTTKEAAIYAIAQGGAMGPRRVGEDNGIRIDHHGGGNPPAGGAGGGTPPAGGAGGGGSDPGAGIID